MTEADVRSRLEAQGVDAARLVIEPVEWFENQAPPGALDGLKAYRLIDPEYTPARDAPGRDWRPALGLGDEILLGPDPRLLDELLARSGYWERPGEFGERQLIQFHRLALDFYKGYEVRERSLEYADGRLVIRGLAGGGDPESADEPFETTVGRDMPARFSVG